MQRVRKKSSPQSDHGSSSFILALVGEARVGLHGLGRSTSTAPYSIGNEDELGHALQFTTYSCPSCSPRPVWGARLVVLRRSGSSTASGSALIVQSWSHNLPSAKRSSQSP
ncbi:unnamed protein product [Prorocentrum cordatum]|uniref:Uncharacterized protein n=1 Tax=Prorocentrum cordatum TaxID=2364126 RepID=A0ABN9WP46_9DINO|nr:unnamed protein product [Polarella glacialis]